MKFSEYVGHKKTEKIKEIVVNTDIGETERDFIEQVARERTVKNYFGFSLSKRTLKKTFDYIRSWLIRYDVPFKPTKPYLTLYSLGYIADENEVIENIRRTKRNKFYDPLGTLTVISRDFPETYPIVPPESKDYIVIDYKANEYNNKLINIFHSIGIDVLEEYGYIKLFEIKRGILNSRIYEDMMYSAPKFPTVKIGNVGMIRSK